MIAILFFVSAGVFAGLGVYRAGTAVHPRSLPQGLCALRQRCALFAAYRADLSGAVSAARHYPVGSDCAVTLPTRCAFAGFLYRLPLFIPFIVVAQMMRTFLAKNGLMNNALVAADLVTPLENALLAGMERDSDHLCLEATGLCHAADLRGRWRRWSRRRSLLHVILAPPGRGSCSISCCRRSCRLSAWRWCCRR